MEVEICKLVFSIDIFTVLIVMLSSLSVIIVIIT